VVTTDHSGIKDVFGDGVNGYRVSKRSSEAIGDVLESLTSRLLELRTMALHNRTVADRSYRSATYCQAIERILES
jgi:glycosyltransferase involved in cell wall biosynthesis